MYSLHLRGSLMKLGAQWNQVERKKHCGMTFRESLFCWRDGYCKLNKDFAWGPKTKSTLASKDLVTKQCILWVYGKNCLDHLQQFNRNSREGCLACRYLQSISLDSLEQQCRSLLNQKHFMHAGTCWKVSNLFRPFWRNTGGVFVSLLTGGTNWWFCIHPQKIKCKLGKYPRLSFQEISSSERELNFMNGDSLLSTWL